MFNESHSLQFRFDFSQWLKVRHPYPNLFFFIGTAVYNACVLTKVQSKTYTEKLRKLILSCLFISQLQIRDLTSVVFQFISVGMGSFSISTEAPRSHSQAKSNEQQATVSRGGHLS